MTILYLATFGGVLYLPEGGSVTITNSNNTGSVAGAGGFLYGVDVDVTITNMINTGGAAVTLGGFLYLQNSTLNMMDVTSIGTIALLGGAAIYSTDSDDITINNCDFESHESTLGGVINIYKSTLTCNNCNSIENRARTSGGFIFIDAGSNVILNDFTSFKDNATYYSTSLVHEFFRFSVKYCTLPSTMIFLKVLEVL